MTRPDPHAVFDELAAGYALGALEPEDEQLLRRHLASCAGCDRAVAEHTETLAHLAYAAPPVEPPAALLEGIRTGLRDSGREVRFPDDAVATARTARARRRRGVRVAWAGVAAAAVLVLGLGVWNATLQRDVQQQAAWGGRLAQTVQALENGSTRSAPLATPDGRVLAVAVVQGDRMSLVVDGLPPNEPGTTYVLWGKGPFSDVRPVGAFDVPKPGLDVLHGMRLEPSAGEVSVFMVTQEAGRTAPPTTTRPVLISGTL